MALVPIAAFFVTLAGVWVRARVRRGLADRSTSVSTS